MRQDAWSCREQGVTYVNVSDAGSAAGTLRSGPVAKCKEWCESTSSCRGFSYDAAEGVCRFVGSVVAQGARDNDDVLGGNIKNETCYSRGQPVPPMGEDKAWDECKGRCQLVYSVDALQRADLDALNGTCSQNLACRCSVLPDVLRSALPLGSAVCLALLCFFFVWGGGFRWHRTPSARADISCCATSDGSGCETRSRAGKRLGREADRSGSASSHERNHARCSRAVEPCGRPRGSAAPARVVALADSVGFFDILERWCEPRRLCFDATP